MNYERIISQADFGAPPYIRNYIRQHFYSLHIVNEIRVLAIHKIPLSCFVYERKSVDSTLRDHLMEDTSFVLSKSIVHDNQSHTFEIWTFEEFG